MEQTPLPPLLSDEILAHLNCRCENCVRRVAKVIEADRAKTREVVQVLCDALQREQMKYSDIVDMLNIDRALEVAKSQLNIEPSKP
jgi:hypothetical protein